MKLDLPDEEVISICDEAIEEFALLYGGLKNEKVKQFCAHILDTLAEISNDRFKHSSKEMVKNQRDAFEDAKEIFL